MSPAQSRMARAGLRLSLDDLAKRSGVSRTSIVRFENGTPIRPVLHRALQAVLTESGVVFTEDGGVLPPPETAESGQGEFSE